MNNSYLYDVGAGLLDAVTEAFEDAGIDVPERHIVVPGAIASWEDCCPGQLTVRLQRLFRARTFPSEVVDVLSAGCGDGGTLAAIYTVEMTACTPQGAKQAPPVRAVDAGAAEALTQAFVAYRGVFCWAQAWNEGHPVNDPGGKPAVIGALDPIGPESGCVGYQVTVTVDLGDACLCDIVPD